MFSDFESPFTGTKRLLAVAIVTTLLLAAVGCGSAYSPASQSSGSGSGSNGGGSNGGGGSSNGNQTQAKSPVQVRLGDDPSDLVMVFAVTLNSVTLTPSTGASVNLLPNPTQLDLAHLSDTSEPLTVFSVPQGNYTQIQVALSNAVVTYFDPTTLAPVKKQVSPASPVTITFNPALVVGTSPSVLTLDFDLKDTINLNMGTGAFSLNTPVINVSQSPVGTSNQLAETGQLNHLLGQVTSVSGTAFTMTLGQTGLPVIFGTDGSTVFTNATLNTLTGMIVAVDGSTNADGTWYAQSVQASENSTGLVLDGMLSGYTNSGNFSMVTQDGVGSGATPALLGATVSVDVNSTNYAINTSGMDMTGITFVFDISDSTPGQSVEVQSSSVLVPDPDGNVGLVTPQNVVLEQQTLSGTVSNYVAASGTAQFDLNLPADGSSYVSAANPGTTTVHVYQQAGTDVHNLANGVQNGQAVRVRGLLFYDPLVGSEFGNSQSTNPFNLVAGRISN